MVDYSKFHKVKCPQCKASLLIKSTVKVCPICEGTLRFLEALREKQYIVRDWNPAECELRDVMQTLAVIEVGLQILSDVNSSQILLV